jgi:hypothetical protein
MTTITASSIRPGLWDFIADEDIVAKNVNSLQVGEHCTAVVYDIEENGTVWFHIEGDPAHMERTLTLDEFCTQAEQGLAVQGQPFGKADPLDTYSRV